MAVGWLASFKTIPWTKVLSGAPSIADGARRLWSSVAGGDAHRKPPEPPEPKGYFPDPVISAVKTQVHALELRTAQLREEVVQSSEIIDKLAEQQSQLVRAVEILRAHIRALLWVCGALGLAVLGLIYVIAGR